MQSTGFELQQAREQAGLSAENIAARTKFKLSKIEALERSDFENLPHGIYLDGIVRAYARELALDPEPLVERLRLERGKRPGDSPIPFHEPMEFQRPAVVETVEFAPVADVVVAEPVHQIAAHVSAPAHRPQRSDNSMAVAVLALLALLGWGAYFYQASRAVDRDTSGKNYLILPAQAAPGAHPIAFTETSMAEAPEPPATEFADDASSDAVRIADTRPSQRRMTMGNGVRPESRRTQSAGPSAILAAMAGPDRAGPSDTADEVTGAWRLATQVESSSVARYEGLLLGYELQLEQDGDRVTGIGRKIIENGHGIGPSGQTPIAVSGVIEGDRITLTFIEGGARRSTQGTFMLMLDTDGMLRGRFSSDAARSAGSVEARRVR